MKICIVGCGAIGSLLAAHLHPVADSVVVFDHGRQAAALKSKGLAVEGADGARIALSDLNVIDDLRSCDPQDVVFLAVKAHEIAPLARDLAALLHRGATLVTLQNGIPWWYFQNLAGPFAGRVIESVDPHAEIARHIPTESIVGCVAYPAAQLVEPGVVRHVEGNRFPIGELDGTTSERTGRISAALVAGGLKSPVLDDIRSEIWLKAWGNLAFNPISALTHATMAQICQVAETRTYAADLMTEAQEVAEQLGIRFRVPLERRLQGAEKVGGHKTSMLQDVEAGRMLELDAILGAVIELADMVGVAVPRLQGLYALAKLRDFTNRSLLS